MSLPHEKLDITKPLVEKPKRVHRSYFQKLSYNAQYLVMSALRGPDHIVYGQWKDSGSSAQVERIGTLKYLITGRLRVIVFPKASPYTNPKFSIDGDMTSTTFTHGDLQLLQETVSHIASKYPQKDARHYVNHLIRAVVVTSSHPIWNGFADAIIEELKKLDITGRSY